MKKVFITLLVLVAFVSASVPAYAATTTTPWHYTRLFYYTDGDLSKASFAANAKSIDIVAPQDYKVNADGTISGTVDPDILTIAKKYGVKVMPLVTNGGFSKATSQEFLGDGAKQQTAINALLAEARDFGYWGYQFDFEQMDASDMNAYTGFIMQADTAFQKAGLKLSVAVIAKTSDNPNDYAPGLWQNLIGAYDYTALAAHADFLSIMSYDDPTSKQGPSPFPWYNQVITYAIAHVPNNKISIGIPDYYWQWQDSTGKLVGIGGNEGIDNVFSKYAKTLTVSYDTTAQEPVLHYTGAGGIVYTLWYENAKSVAPKIALATVNHLYGVSIWTLGLELPSIYGDLKE